MSDDRYTVGFDVSVREGCTGTVTVSVEDDGEYYRVRVLDASPTVTALNMLHGNSTTDNGYRTGDNSTADWPYYPTVPSFPSPPVPFPQVTFIPTYPAPEEKVKVKLTTAEADALKAAAKSDALMRAVVRKLRKAVEFEVDAFAEFDDGDEE